MIIGLGFFPDQSRQINRLAAGRSFGEGQLAEFLRDAPSPRTCLLGVVLSENPPMYIFVISPTAEATGLRLGDRITAVDGERISSLREARGALSRTGSRSHRVDVDRTGETITVDVPCVDEAPRWTATRRVFETAARGDWDGCLAAVNDAQRADGTARSLWARWRGRCVEAKNHRR